MEQYTGTLNQFHIRHEVYQHLQLQFYNPVHNRRTILELPLASTPLQLIDHPSHAGKPLSQ